VAGTTITAREHLLTQQLQHLAIISNLELPLTFEALSFAGLG
jgi:hypothetical protein